MMVKKPSNNIEVLDTYDYDDDGFSEGDVKGGRAVASFSFGISDDLETKSEPLEPASAINSSAPSLMFTNQGFRNSQRGLTPAVDGELYTIKRCYQFRPSTIRKLSEIKANHPDFNVYLNTIIDEAISYYYDHIFSKNSN